MKRAFLTQFGKCCALIRKTVIVDNVPMENIQFVERHAIDNLFECENIDEMPRCVDEQATMLETWTVMNLRFFYAQLKSKYFNQ